MMRIDETRPEEKGGTGIVRIDRFHTAIADPTGLVQFRRQIAAIPDALIGLGTFHHLIGSGGDQPIAVFRPHAHLR